MPDLVWVAVGGAVGAVSRYAVALAASRLWGQTFPWGTLIVNVVGCLLLGFLAEFCSHRPLPAWQQRALGVGFLGALTTFSTFAIETFQLWENQRPTAAIASIASNLGIGLLAVWLGVCLARRGA